MRGPRGMFASQRLRAMICLGAAWAALALVGCARGGDVPIVPQAVMDIMVEFAGAVDESAYYFIALDRDGDFGADYPVPVAAGPLWGNGWGTGSITHQLLYRLGRYEFFESTLAPVLREAGGGITAVAGVPEGGDAGRFTLRVGPIAYGAVTVAGAGMITGATNNAGQNAGDIALATDGAGNVVAASVAFTPAADGGRTMNAEEQAQIAALNAGGAALTANSLDAFGIALTLGAPAAGAQTLTIAPAEAAVEATFVPVAAGGARTSAATIRANSSTPTATTPIPGATITTGDLATGGEADIDVEISQTPELIGPPFAYTLPGGGSRLRATVDLADLGVGLTDLSLNVIATTELIFDPTITDPDRNSYDALGPLGNDAVTFATNEYRTYTNAGSFVREGANDATLEGFATPEQKAAIDIIDWSVTIRRLQ